MRYRTLGRKTGLLVSEIALGASLFGVDCGYGATPEDARAILDDYLDAGGNIVDTSSRYRFGQSEEMLGSLMGSRRDSLILATKYGRSDRREPPLAELGAHRKSMIQSVEASLKRLRTDRIDLLFIHVDDLLTPIDEVIRGMDDLVRAGKVIYGGFSNYPAWRLAYGAALAETRGWTPISAIQIEYSLLQRTPERELLPMADATGMGVLGYSPLAGGLLTGKYRSGSGGRAIDYKESVLHDDSGHNAEVIGELLAIAAELHITPSQLAIVWMLTKEPIPLIGPRTAKQLADNLAALNITLDPEHLARLDRVSAVSSGYPHELVAAPRERTISSGGRKVTLPKPARQVL